MTLTLEEITASVVDLLGDMVGDKELFPSGSCIGVCAFLVPFIRLEVADPCRVVVGHYGERAHAWIEIDRSERDGRVTVVDPTVAQFGKELPRVIQNRYDTSDYRPAFALTRDQECDLRDHAELSEFALSTRDGRRLLHRRLA